MRLRDTLAPHVHRAQQAGLAVLAWLGYGVTLGTPAAATVIILSYGRMRNIPAIVRSALLCRFVEKVIVSNNNPDIDLSPYLSVRDPRLEVVQQDQRRWPSYRYDLARQDPAEYYICIDDDVFPSPWQLRRMFAAFLRDPSSPRGTAGQVYDERCETLVRIPRRGSPWASTVDVILHTYVFSMAHLDRYFQLIEAIGMRNSDIHSSEDVILSLAGTSRPIVDRFGFLFRCPTSRDPEISIHRSDGFSAFRDDLYRKLRALPRGPS